VTLIAGRCGRVPRLQQLADKLSLERIAAVGWQEIIWHGAFDASCSRKAVPGRDDTL